MFLTEGLTKFRPDVVTENINLDDYGIDGLDLEPTMESMYMILAESVVDQINLHRIAYRMDCVEIAALKENNTEILTHLYEQETPKFMTRVKDALKNAWDYLVTMFRNFKKWVDEQLDFDKKFVAEMGPKLEAKKGKLAGFTTKGHVWNVDEMLSILNNIGRSDGAGNASTIINQLNTNMSKEKLVEASEAIKKINTIEAVCAQYGIDGVTDTKTFTKKLTEKVRGEEKEKMPASDIPSDVMNEISLYKWTKVAIAATEKAIKKSIADGTKILSDATKAMQDANKGDWATLKVGIINDSIGAAQKSTSVTTIACSVVMSALKARQSEYKRFVREMVAYEPSK